MKVFALALAAALAFASESAASQTPNLRASLPDFVEEAGSEGRESSSRQESRTAGGSSCVRAGWGNCKADGNEGGKPCCDGSTCEYVMQRKGGEGNPSNFKCVYDSSSEDVAVE